VEFGPLTQRQVAWSLPVKNSVSFSVINHECSSVGLAAAKQAAGPRFEWEERISGATLNENWRLVVDYEQLRLSLIHI